MKNMLENEKNNLSFLLEIGTEDIPARFLSPALEQLRVNTEKILNEHYIGFSEIQTYGTPRRLAVIADGISPYQEDRVREVFGPSKKAAFDAEGNPTRAAQGFAQSQGVHVDTLVIKKKGKGEYVVAVIDEKGAQVKQIIPEVFQKIIFSMHFPKSMRWGNGDIRFARPIRWIMAIFDRETVQFDIDGIQSSNVTKGHRFLSPAGFQIKDVQRYKKLLAKNYVMVEREERETMILDQIENLLAPYNEKPVLDEDLLETVLNLVEYPVPVLGTFPQEYLILPRELLIIVMKDHQKYFAVENSDGQITNHFIVTSNTSQDNADIVRIGAERVIKARFEDARFYYEDDIKKKLAERVDELKKVTYQERLGSVYEKTERVISLAGVLAERINPSLREKVTRAALLGKADLITGVVREFPELQGVMGKYYAIHDGEGHDVGEAIEEQYLPSHSGGELPVTDVGSLLSMADKLDSVAAFFSIGLIPSGSEDPFALRRQALGIIAILLKRDYSINLQELVDVSLRPFSQEETSSRTSEQIMNFFLHRLETMLSDIGYSNDVIQSIIPLSPVIHFQDIVKRLDVLKTLKKQDDCIDFLAAIKRVNNILSETDLPPVEDGLLIEEAEKRLNEKISSIGSSLQDLIEKQDYEAALSILFSSTESINLFFDKVLVMDKDEKVRQNRLSLLNEVWKTASSFTDFSKLSST